MAMRSRLRRSRTRARTRTRTAATAACLVLVLVLYLLAVAGISCAKTATTTSTSPWKPFLCRPKQSIKPSAFLLNCLVRRGGEQGEEEDIGAEEEGRGEEVQVQGVNDSPLLSNSSSNSSSNDNIAEEKEDQEQDGHNEDNSAFQLPSSTQVHFVHHQEEETEVTDRMNVSAADVDDATNDDTASPSSGGLEDKGSVNVAVDDSESLAVEREEEEEEDSQSVSHSNIKENIDSHAENAGQTEEALATASSLDASDSSAFSASSFTDTAAANAIAANATTATANNAAAITNIITPEMKTVLMKELKYTKTEVANMNPEHAHWAVQKRLWRPWEGMPASWYHNESNYAQDNKGKGVGARRTITRKTITRLVVSTMIGTIIIRDYLRNGNEVVVDLDHILSWIASLKSRLLAVSVINRRFDPPRMKASRSALTPVTSALESDDDDDDDETTTSESLESESEPSNTSIMPEVEPEPPMPVNHHVNTLDEPHEHSIKPHGEPIDEECLDVTWLDKAITSIEKAIVSFFTSSKSKNTRKRI